MPPEITITEVGEDDYEVVRDRRVRLVPNSTTLDHAKQVVQRARTPTDRVVLVERDGYRTDLTRDFARRR